MEKQVVALGQAGSDAYAGLETFPNPGVEDVELVSDELTAVCPITNQPDFYTATIAYEPDGLCLESKSLKIYLSRFRDHEAFCEALAVQIRDESPRRSSSTERACTSRCDRRRAAGSRLPRPSRRAGRTLFVAGARWAFRGKDAGSPCSRRLQGLPRTQHRGVQRGHAAQPVFGRPLLQGTANGMDDETPATEGNREWRELTQQTNEQANELQPPHDDETERRSPTPARPDDDDS
jgi:hypothetical protein